MSIPLRNLYLALFIMGASWGVSPVLVKIAVSAGHHPFGLIVWTNLVSVIMSGVVTFARGRR